LILDSLEAECENSMRMKSKLKSAIETTLSKENHSNLQQKQEIETLKRQLEDLR